MRPHEDGNYLDELNLLPIGSCSRCGRKIWKRETIGELDEMMQPDGGICGGRFVANPSANKPGGEHG